jgi:esterase/lipase superfamily enzyme
MRKEVHRWYSPRIGGEMRIKVYGHYGLPLLMFPTAAADFEEYERFHLIGAIKHLIDNGKVKVFSIDSVNQHTWMNNNLHPGERARRHQFYDAYVTKEVVPFIWNHQGGRGGIITTGCSLGAYHAMNSLLRHPHLFDGTIAMSGTYHMKQFIGNYCDDAVYFNSPLYYIPNLHDHGYLEALRSKKIHILTGSGDYEDPSQSARLARDLWAKHVPANLDIWGQDMRHDWPTWRRMLPMYLEHAF